MWWKLPCSNFKLLFSFSLFWYYSLFILLLYFLYFSLYFHILFLISLYHWSSCPTIFFFCFSILCCLFTLKFYYLIPLKPTPSPHHQPPPLFLFLYFLLIQFSPLPLSICSLYSTFDSTFLVTLLHFSDFSLYSSLVFALVLFLYFLCSLLLYFLFFLFDLYSIS